MKLRGYQLIFKNQLPAGIRTHENNLFDITYYPLAGK